MTIAPATQFSILDPLGEDAERRSAADSIHQSPRRIIVEPETFAVHRMTLSPGPWEIAAVINEAFPAAAKSDDMSKFHRTEQNSPQSNEGQFVKSSLAPGDRVRFKILAPETVHRERLPPLDVRHSAAPRNFLHILI